jgi:hypothetical protein
MKYTFVLCSPDARFPDYKDWYLKLTDPKQIGDMHDMLTKVLDSKFGKDPHLFNQKTGEPVSSIAPIFHPSVLGAHWITTAISMFQQHGVVYVGALGQMFPPVNFVIHTELEKAKLAFPTEDNSEIITITKWKDGLHYYLSSNKGRIFEVSRYSNYDSAFKEAKRHVGTKRIKYKENTSSRFYTKEGD